MEHARVEVGLGRDARGGEAAGVGEALVAQRVAVGEDEEGRGQSGDVGRQAGEAAAGSPSGPTYCCQYQRIWAVV